MVSARPARLYRGRTNWNCMDPYRHFSIQDFIWDQDFRAWVLNPTRANYQMWSNWLAENPDKNHTVQLAREIVLALQCREPVPDEMEIERTIRRTLNQIA